MLKTRKKAPIWVLFCGLLQSFNSPGIDSTHQNWYLTKLIILMREINRYRKSAS
ncbi:hypothetical protein H922_24235 [Citrobacter freundii GTC 09629]|jgi:hypothetical protein|nr:hypothetical protein H262_19483 [Citrobacter freundii GTC 09479]EOD57449.1 hypothetical protein H922_24235 [Citrobacter freundii GTC 09629]KWZ88689.1 hypothetical protein HMPREF3212_03756 [Citrobacter freundii]